MQTTNELKEAPLTGVKENEVVDDLARRGSSSPFIGASPSFGTTKSESPSTHRYITAAGNADKDHHDQDWQNSS